MHVSSLPLPPATWLYDVVEEPLLVYGQAAQDGYALLDQSLLHLDPTHLIDLPLITEPHQYMPTYLPRPQLVTVLIFRWEHLHHDSIAKGWWRLCPGFLGNQWANLTSVPCITDKLPLSPATPRTKTAAVSCPPSDTHSGVLLQDPASDMEAPPPIKALISLLLTLGSFWGWASAGIAGLHSMYNPIVRNVKLK